MRQLTAIMFTDLVGFSALMQDDEDHATATVRRHREVLDRHVRSHEGRILQFYGDGTLSVFPSAVNAVESAVEIQRELRADPAIPLRIGIHTGDIIHDETGVYGDGVNVAARIQGLGIGGSVLLSAKVNDEVKNHPGIRTRRLGAFDLKNLRQPLEVLAVDVAGLAVPGPADMPTAADTRRHSVAVLPFVSMSADPDNEYFSDGITEDVINVLTRLDGLKVTARTSSFAFKGQNIDIRDIGQRLGVGAVLEGSVRRAGDRVRVAAQLIDTQTGYHLFSKVFDRSLEDVFRVQDDISTAIVEELEVHLGQLNQGRPARELHGEGCNCDAYTEYLRGLHQFNRWTPEGARNSIAFFDRASELDASWAEPLANKAGALVFLAAIGYRSASEAYPEAEQAARRALELDPSHGAAHAVLGLARLFYDWDFEGAYASFQRALTLNPGSSRVHQLNAFYLQAVGELDESVRELETAYALDPLSFSTIAELARAYSLTGRNDDGFTLAREGIRLEPSFRALREELAFIQLARGEVEAAIRELEELPRLTGDPYTSAGVRGYAYAVAGKRPEALSMLDLLIRREAEQPGVSLHGDFAMIYTALGELDAAVDRLERFAAVRQAGAVYMSIWPHWEPLRSHPRFQALTARIRGTRALV
jgi:TolB-like protein/class 3 adenylate cyclase/tetratricopeptide (TPR) repeat protein